MNPHAEGYGSAFILWFFADPDPAVFRTADPDPAALKMRIQVPLKKLCKILPSEEFSVVEKNTEKDRTIELVHIYSKNLNKITIINRTNFLFSLF